MNIRWVTPILTRAQAQEKYVKDEIAVGIIPAIFNFFQGRATAFAMLYGFIGVVFAGCAVYGFLHRQDLSGLASVITSFAAFLGALQAMLFAHSCKEDWTEIQHRKLDLQQQAVNVVVNNEPPASSAPTVKS